MLTFFQQSKNKNFLSKIGLHKQKNQLSTFSTVYNNTTKSQYSMIEGDKNEIYL